MTEAPKLIRCAIYTRKSHDEGLEQTFNSLDAQRTAGENFIMSQRQEGWVLVPQRYDDGGYSGGTLKRPALQQLLSDIKSGLVECVVVYKIDRLSRSLLDFAKIIDLFDDAKASFVSITQSFNTSSSMGRLMLNVLLSFAQYERELTGERIRDKFALSRQKGMWMGGTPPLGYDVENRKLVINAAESKLVYLIFERFAELGSVTSLVRELNSQGYTSKSWTAFTGRTYDGKPFSKNTLRSILLNPLYHGAVVHKGKIYPGQHTAIIDLPLWEKVQRLFLPSGHSRERITTNKTPALLKGLIRCGACACAMVPVSAKKGHKHYQYYVCASKRKGLETSCVPLAAGEVERCVTTQLRKVLRCPEMTAAVCRTITQDTPLSESKVICHLQNLEAVWEDLFPHEQQRIVQMLVETVIMTAKGLDVRIRSMGLKSLLEEIGEMKDDKEILEAKVGEAA